SDRPYRRRMSDSDALAILNDRRGRMYDPMILDAFSRVHSRPSGSLDQASVSNHVLNTIVHSRSGSNPEQVRITDHVSMRHSSELLSVYGLTRALAGRTGVTDAADVIQRHISRLIPSALSIFFMYDKHSDELEARHIVGDDAIQFVGLRISAGQRISGWVASNRKTVVNSDAMLDLEANRMTTTVLRSCLSTPLVAHNDLVGALTLYSTESNAFDDDDRRLIESIAKQISHTLYRAREIDAAIRHDRLTGLPPVEQLEAVLESISEAEPTGGSSHALIVVEVHALEAINAAHGRAFGDDVLRHIVRQVQEALRVGDILFRSSGDDFIVLLNGAEGNTAEVLSRRISDQIAEHDVLHSPKGSIQVNVSVTSVPIPIGTTPIRDLIKATRQRSALRIARFDQQVIH